MFENIENNLLFATLQNDDNFDYVLGKESTYNYQLQFAF